MKLKDFWYIRPAQATGDSRPVDALNKNQATRTCTSCRKKILQLAVECPYCGKQVRENAHFRVTQEPVLLWAEGTNGIVELLEEKIRIKRKGVSSLFTHGLQGEKDILISRLSSIQLKRCGGLTKGYIQFAFMGGTEAKSGVLQAAADENTVMFNEMQQSAFEAMRKRLDDKMKNPTSASGVPSYLDELEKLASLRDKGIVTEEEFDSKKRKLLELP